MNLIQKIREFLKDNKIDYLLVNSTNEFLVEYSDLMENSRYFLTNFSGSTGDALISQTDIFLFVDGRYHEQADAEVDKKLVNVIKMQLGETITKWLAKKIKSKKTLAIVAQKNSQGRVEIIQETLKKKGVKVKLLDIDPVMDLKPECETRKESPQIEKIGIEITGRSADEKFEKISAALEKNEAILNTNLEEISYLCNLRDFSNNYSSKIEGKCLITKEFAVLFADSHIENIGTHFRTQKLTDFREYINNLDNIDKIFVDKTSINAYDYNFLKDKTVPLVENELKLMKSVKTEAEIEHYKKCFERTDKTIMATRAYIEKHENLSECDIAKRLEENFYKFGAKSLSFKSIVAKDKNSALAHYSKCSKTEILKEGSLVLIDCGAYYEGGYATDCTRVFVKGAPSALQKKIYTTVLKGFLKAFNKKVTNKTTGFSLDKAARTLLLKTAPAGFNFSHSLGHGIGINVHEAPPSLAFSPTAKTPLKPNMCFTIEPGLYNPKLFGIRLENSCYLEKGKEERGNGEFIIKSFSDMCFEKKLIDFSLLTPTEKKQLKLFTLSTSP